jgi:hypothetical protein
MIGLLLAGAGAGLSAGAGEVTSGDAGLVYNVQSYGAKGDGVVDDTAALQAALDAAKAGGRGGEVLVPSGKYMIYKTLRLFNQDGLILRGQGQNGWNGNFNVGSALVWNGAAGGTLLEVIGGGGMVFRDLLLAGRMTGANREQLPRAGILFLVRTEGAGAANTNNRISGLTLFDADAGLQIGTKANEATSSDWLIEQVSMRFLDRGFLVRNDQGVNFLFNFVFALQCGTVFCLERGGNLEVNNGVCTDCGVFAEILGGGRNTGTYLFNNCRAEWHDGGEKERTVVLRCRPCYRQAQVRFVNYCDPQWAWHLTRGALRQQPLCEIGPGSTVVFESAIFNTAPLATLTGDQDAPAILIVRNSCRYPDPVVAANEYGYYQLLDCTTDMMVPLPDTIRWPKLKPVLVEQGPTQFAYPDPPPAKAQ